MHLVFETCRRLYYKLQKMCTLSEKTFKLLNKAFGMNLERKEFVDIIEEVC